MGTLSTHFNVNPSGGQDCEHLCRSDNSRHFGEVFSIVGHHIGIFDGERYFIKDLISRVRVHFG